MNVGVDEAGRGALCGPVVAGACILKEEISGLKDSKKLTPKQRDRLYDEIRQKSYYAIGTVNADTIDEINILEATKLAMKMAIENVKEQLTIEEQAHLKARIDGNMTFNDLPVEYESIVKGDTKEMCISAASILAKVHRDRLMVEYGEKYPEWKFEKHKGYGTHQHIALIREHGISPIHRKTFEPIKSFLREQIENEGEDYPESNDSAD